MFKSVLGDRWWDYLNYFFLRNREVVWDKPVCPNHSAIKKKYKKLWYSHWINGLKFDNLSCA